MSFVTNHIYWFIIVQTIAMTLAVVLAVTHVLDTFAEREEVMALDYQFWTGAKGTTNPFAHPVVWLVHLSYCVLLFAAATEGAQEVAPAVIVTFVVSAIAYLIIFLMRWYMVVQTMHALKSTVWAGK